MVCIYILLYIYIIKKDKKDKKDKNKYINSHIIIKNKKSKKYIYEREISELKVSPVPLVPLLSPFGHLDASRFRIQQLS